MKRKIAEQLIDAVHNNDAQTVCLLTKHTSIAENTRGLAAAAANGYLECLNILRPISDHNNHQPLVFAATYGHVECVEKLLSVPHSIEGCNRALGAAAARGHSSCVKLLAPLSEPHACNRALCRAAENGHDACVAVLISMTTPLEMDTEALATAAEKGHIKCVKLLLDHSDAKADDSAALYWAAYNGQHEVVDLLFDVSEPQVALNALVKQYTNEAHRWQYLKDKIEAHNAQEQKDILLAQTQTKSGVKNQRKM